MSLPIPKLDDRNFDDLMKEACSLIPAYNKEWTNYNPSDPGITILEFFAWVVEMTIFRIDQVPEENYHKYLKLLGVEMNAQGTGTISSEGVRLTGDGTAFTKELEVGDHIYIEASDQTRIITGIISDTSLNINLNFAPELPSGTQFKSSYGSIESGISRGLKSISQRYRAITLDDYEHLSIECMEALQKKPGGRAICVNNRDLELGKADKKEGHISVIIIPECGEDTDYCKDGMPTENLKNKVKAYLDARRLITTRVHVVEPRYKKIQLDILVALKENTVENEVRTKANEIIQGYFDPLKGGQDEIGWPLGRDVYRSEIFHLVEGISGVDHVIRVLINGFDINSKAVGEYQLVKLESINIEV